MRIFDVIFNVIVEHPVIGGSFGAFLAAIIASVLGQGGLAVGLVVIGIVLAVAQIFVSSRQ